MSEKAMGNKFFYVARDIASGTHVSYRHATINSAYAEAIKLAKKENAPFFILQTVARIVPEVKIKEVEDVRLDNFREPADEDFDADKMACEEFVKAFEESLSKSGFERDPFTNTWNKSF